MTCMHTEGQAHSFVLSDMGRRRAGSERRSDGLWLEFSKAPAGP